MAVTTQNRQAGFTLIELLVASGLLSLVLVIVGGLFMSVTTTQRTVTDITTTTSIAQTTASIVEHGVRNSSEFSLTAPTTSTQLLVVRTATETGVLQWVCRAWYYSPAAGGSIRSAQTSDGTKIFAPSAAQLATWTLVATGITPRSGTGIFAAASGGITIAYSAQVTGQPPVIIETTAVKRTGVAGASSCF